MISNDNSIPAPALCFIRVLTGVIFMMQGYGKVFTWGVPKVYEMFFKNFETTFLPKWLIVTSTYYTSYIELIGGLLLIIGLFRKYALYLLAIDLLVVSFGHGLMEPIWDLSHVMPRAILLAALMLLPEQWDKWQLDYLLRTKKK
jgi:putative oxidoreductase